MPNASKENAENIVAMTEDWVRVCHKRSALEAEVVAQRARMADLEAGRDRDVRRASRVAHREVSRKYMTILKSLERRWASKE